MLFSMGHTFDARNIEIWVYAFCMLNVAQMTLNDVRYNCGIGVLHVNRQILMYFL